MKFNLRLLIPFCASALVFLSGCGRSEPTPVPGLLTLDLVSPQTSIVIWPQAPYILAAQASAQGSGTNPSSNEPVHVAFFANGQMIGSVDSSTGSQAVLKWTPPEVGEYTIQAQAQTKGSNASSKTVQICILKIDTSRGFRLWGYGYDGPCVLPPVSTSEAPVALTATEKPASLTYSHHCSSSVSPSIINFQVKVNDPGNRVSFVDIFYTGQNYSYKSPFVSDGADRNDLYDSMILNETSVASDGTKVYTGSTEDLGPISSSILSGAAAVIEWSARALTNGVGTSQILAEDGPYTVPIGPCTAPTVTP